MQQKSFRKLAIQHCSCCGRPSHRLAYKHGSVCGCVNTHSTPLAVLCSFALFGWWTSFTALTGNHLLSSLTPAASPRTALHCLDDAAFLTATNASVRLVLTTHFPLAVGAAPKCMFVCSRTRQSIWESAEQL